MIKGILFDWYGVLVKSKDNCNNKIDYLYKKSNEKTASENEIIEIVNSYEKYKPLWGLIPDLSKNYKMCVVNNGPKETCEYWDKYFSYSKYMGFVNSETIGIRKPNPEIYKIS